MRRRTNRQSYAVFSRSIHGECQILEGEVDGEARLHVALEHLVHHQHMELAVARSGVAGDVMDGLDV